MFLGEMHDKKVMRKNKKLFLLQPGWFGLRAFFGFFWPEEGRRPSEGQKNPFNRPKAKTSLVKAKQVFFVIPKDEKCRALTLKYHFLIIGPFFLFKK